MSEEEKPDKQKAKRLLNWLAAVLVLLGALAIFVIFGNQDSGNEVKQPSQETESAKRRTKTKQHFTNANFPKVISHTNKYKGATVNIVGMIFQPPKKNGNAWQFQIHIEPMKSEGNAIIVANTDLKLKDGDIVRVKGTVEKEFDYENMMGGKVSTPLIIADNVQYVAVRDVLAPTKNSIEVNQIQDQHGIVITLKKVEFAESETRFYVHVKNITDRSAKVYTFNMKITQGSKQYDEERGFGSNYPELQSDLLPGAESEGVVMFPKLDYNAHEFKFFAEASSDNNNLDFNPYQFLVQWQQ